MRRIGNLAFDNSYARLPPALYQVVEPTPLPDPRLVAFNPDAALLLDLDPGESAPAELAAYLSGGRRIPGAEPIAQLYAGHQFGVWVPELGDGRAFLLGEVRSSRGGHWDLHLKGGGQTRYSRGGDGRSVLRSAIREYLGSEALHALGVPTTRALAVVASDLPVRREVPETAATLLRLAPSHVRFGTFQALAARGSTELVRILADFVIVGHFPELIGEANRYRRFFEEVVLRTARLVARWMAAGFAHGVLNSDNMSVLGLTLDYGPYGFQDEFDPGFSPNHSDTEGRYAWDRQPAVGRWNLARFGEALLSLASGDDVQAALDRYRETFAATYGALMRDKLGLATAREEDAALVRDLLALLAAGRVDYTNFFRELGEVETQRSALLAPLRLSAFAPWLSRYTARLAAEGSVDAERWQRMQRVNPAYILRTWMAQEAIEAARRGEFEAVERLRAVLADPFTEREDALRYTEPPPAWARDLAVSCSS